MNPPRNRKGGTGNPPPTAGAPEFYPNGAADKAANLERWKSFFRQLPVFGRIAYPVRAEVTKHVLPGSKSLSCPAAILQR